MSAFPDAEVRVYAAPRAGLSPVQYAALATTLAVLGVSTIWFPMRSLWAMWTTDALKSIGMVVPLVSLVLILRAWKAINWEVEGSWWGLLILLATMVLARIQQQTIFMMVISPHWYTVLPPPSLMLMAYGSGVVLLLGGARLYGVAFFPIVLLLFSNPIPHVFSVLVDLPLQYLSAHIARAFAMSLGQPLTADHLRLMFTPDFGMFIAPGCNGIRGSVTMGFIALIAGYVYRFRWYANALAVIGAVLLGYVFNLARLCLLVLYYAVALHYPSLQNKAENADYAIGGLLFLIATVLLFTVIHRLRDRAGSIATAVVPLPEAGLEQRMPRRQYLKLIAIGGMVLAGGAGLVRANAAINPYRPIANAATEPFPLRLGSYMFVRSWNETAVLGPIVYSMAQYVPEGGGTPITVGVSPGLGWHDPLLCHLTRGDLPLWQGQLEITTSDAVPINFSSAFYSDGATQYVEASTICSGGVCDEFASERSYFGFLYTRPNSHSLLSSDPRRPIPVLLRVETIDVVMPADAAREQLTADLREFLGAVSLSDFTRSTASYPPR